MSLTTIRIATRKSALAWWQAEHVAKRLQELYPSLTVELIGLTTQGDRILDAPLAHIGGKGLFVKELEQGILTYQADIAVHSMKDVPIELPDGLHLAAILAREDPLDVLVSNFYQDIHTLPIGSIVGTSSLRRECQLRATRPDLQLQPLRGNVNTRLQRLDAGQYAAIILASAGLKRLGLAGRIRQQLSPAQSLPAIGQGAIGIECRVADVTINSLVTALNDPVTYACISAERAMNKHLNGGCQVPIGGYAILEENQNLYLRGLVGSQDGQLIVRAEGRTHITQAENLGHQVAESLLTKGAGNILNSIVV